MPRPRIDDLEILKNFQNVNWDDDEERNDCLEEFYDLISSWKGQLPNLRDFFRKKDIDWLLMKDVESGHSFNEFVIKTGYRDEPDVDENGEPVLRRTTAVHRAKKQKYYDEGPNLFKIYHRFDVNYTDEFGLTHFHVACRNGYRDIAEKFLELGQDPNCLEYITGNSPLHLHLSDDFFDEQIVQLLLRNGANPNLTNVDGVTPLHIMCRRKQFHNKNLAQIFFKITDDNKQTIEIDARDKFGRTPLQLAVANILPKTVDVILNHGADLSNFVFPTLGHFVEGLESENEHLLGFKLRLASGFLVVLDHIEKRGYELTQNDTLTIMSFFAKYGLFETPADLEKPWYNDKIFVSTCGFTKITSSLTLYDLTRLQPEEVKKQIPYMDVFEFAIKTNCYLVRNKPSHAACAAHLGEILSRVYFRRWALDPFVELTRNQLPILCCEKIIKNLKNEDLWRICLAAKAQGSP